MFIQHVFYTFFLSLYEIRFSNDLLLDKTDRNKLDRGLAVPAVARSQVHTDIKNQFFDFFYLFIFGFSFGSVQYIHD